MRFKCNALRAWGQFWDFASRPTSVRARRMSQIVAHGLGRRSRKKRSAKCDRFLFLFSRDARMEPLKKQANSRIRPVADCWESVAARGNAPTNCSRKVSRGSREPQKMGRTGDRKKERVSKGRSCEFADTGDDDERYRKRESFAKDLTRFCFASFFLSKNNEKQKKEKERPMPALAASPPSRKVRESWNERRESSFAAIP